MIIQLYQILGLTQNSGVFLIFDQGADNSLYWILWIVIFIVIEACIWWINWIFALFNIINESDIRMSIIMSLR